MVAQFLVMAGLLGAPLAGSGPSLPASGRVEPADTSLASLYAARERAWRDYFGNTEGLAQALPADFTGIAGDSTWSDRATTLAQSRASIARGTRLVALRFPRNRVERYGNVAVIHSRYEAVLEGEGGGTLRGNITEVFVWNGTRWMHPSWHMDFDPQPSQRH